jgi:cytosine deaminase
MCRRSPYPERGSSGATVSCGGIENGGAVSGGNSSAPSSVIDEFSNGGISSLRGHGTSILAFNEKGLCLELHSINLEAMTPLDSAALLAVAIREARTGLAEGGIPIGAAIFRADGTLLGSGHNRRVQHSDPSAHGETDAFRNAGRQRSYRDLIMVTTLAPCWYCSGLIRQFGFRKVIIGESQTFRGGIDWLRESGIEIQDLQSPECIQLMSNYISNNRDVWNEDIGED